MVMKIRWMAVLICGLVAASAFAQDNRTVGLQVGAFLPTSSAAQDLFGKQWLSVSLTPRPYDLKPGLSYSENLNVLGRDNNGNKVFMLLPTYGARFVMGDINAKGMTPYVAARVGPAYFDYSLTYQGVRHSTKRVGFTGHIEVGAWFNKSFRVYGQYNKMSEFDGVRFDGFEVGVAFALFKF